MGRITRLAVEEVPYIELKQFKGFQVGDVFRMSGCGVEAVVTLKKDCMLLEYEFNDELIRDAVRIDATKTGFGLRPWFVCPYCGHRTARLYYVSIFACRECHKLVYTSSKRSGNELNYLGWKIRKRQRELGMPTGSALQHQDWIDIHALPETKPKGMRRTTFERMVLELQLMQDARDEAWLRMAR